MSKLNGKTLFEHIRDFLKVYLPKQRRCSSNTIAAYRITLELLIDFAKTKHHIPIQDVTVEMLDYGLITEYLDWLETERNCSIATRNHRLAAIRAFFTYAAAIDITVVAALHELQKIPLKKPVADNPVPHMSETAVKTILNQPDITTSKGIRNRFFMILMYDTGARVQEMIDLKLCDFRICKTPTVSLHGKGGKMRTVPLMEKTVEHLQQYLSVFHADAVMSADTNLFYLVTHGIIHPISNDCVGKFVKRYGETARLTCLEVPENVHPHLFRHSRAMHLYQHGMDLTLVSQWLGHANLETTLVYAHADTEQKRKAIDAATPKGDPLRGRLNPARYTVSDENQLKLLYGLK